MLPKRDKALAEDFRNRQGISTRKERGNERKKLHSKTQYELFLKEKYCNLETTLSFFNTRDIVYFFRAISEDCGYSYSIVNIRKEMALVKQVLAQYSQREICEMIEFLFLSEQTYLNKSRIGVGILCSRWVNTIYADLQLWKKGEFNPKNKRQIRGEWNTSSESEDGTLIDVEL